jgi:hypothetical protein
VVDLLAKTLAKTIVYGAGPKEAMAQAQTLGGGLLLPAAIFTYALQVEWPSICCAVLQCAMSPCSDKWLSVMSSSTRQLAPLRLALAQCLYNADRSGQTGPSKQRLQDR